MRHVVCKMLALVYAAMMGILLYINIPRLLLAADGSASFWPVLTAFAGLLLGAGVVSLPLRGLLHLGKKPCGKFLAVCCAALVGAPVTYELIHYMSSGFFSGELIGGLFVFCGGILMMACPIVAMYKYVA